MDLTTKALRGIGWSGLSQVFAQGFQFLFKIILARLLIPNDFGIIGMAIIFTVLIQTVNELGLSAAIIQRKDVNEKHLSTSFWISILIGVILFIIAILVSPLIADFFKERLVQPVFSILSIGFIIGSFGVVHRALLHKKIDFKSVAITETGAAFLSGFVSVILAYLGFGVWSLVIGSLMGTIGRSILLWVRCSWRPSLTFDFKSFDELFSFGRNVMGSRILNYISANIDYLFIGRFLNTYFLGLYTLAYQMAVFPQIQISTTISRVTFPTFSKFQDDNAKLRFGYLKTIKYISLLTFPILSGLATIAHKFIIVVIGEKWEPMILPLQILCISGLINSIGHHVGSMLLSKGRSDIEFKWNVFQVFVFLIAIIISIRYGIVGVAIAVTITHFLLFFIIQSITNKLINLSYYEFLKALYPAVVCSGILVIIVFVYQWVNTLINISDLTSLIGSIIVGALIYFLAIFIIDKDSIKEIIIMFKKAIGR